MVAAALPLSERAPAFEEHRTMSEIKKRAVPWAIVFPALVACSGDPRLPNDVPPQDDAAEGGPTVSPWPDAEDDASGGLEAGEASNGGGSDAEGDRGDGDGTTSAPGPCASPTRECSPGQTSSTQVDCQGSCGPGKATQALRCGSDCAWTNSGPPGPCDSKGQCVPGAHQQRTVSCSCPGDTKTQQETCTNGCTWDAKWVDLDTSRCSVACCGEVVYCDTPASVAPNRGTWCRKTTSACSDAEAWADCDALLASIGCTLHQPTYLD
jgi:hypothetical protein